MDKKRAILISFVAIVLISLAFGAIAQAAAEETTISVSPSTVEGSHGDTFTIEIEIDPAGAEVYGAQFDLYFNSNLVNASSQSQGTFLSRDGATTSVIVNRINSSTGKIEYAETRIGMEQGVIEPGVLVSITFDVIGTSGTSELKLSNVILSDPEVVPIDTAINSGTCTIATDASATASPTAPTTTDISAEEAHQMLEEEDAAAIVLLDVRTEAEYNAEHIADAEHIPLSELEGRIGELDADKKVIVYCKIGDRSRTASAQLVQQGFTDVYNMLGGLSAWRVLYPGTLVKPTSTPTVAPSALIAPSPGGSSSPVVSPIVSPSPASATATQAPAGNGRTPGFGVVFGIAAIAIAMSILKRKKEKGGNKK